MAPDHDLFQTPPLTSLSVYFCSNLPGTLLIRMKLAGSGWECFQGPGNYLPYTVCPE